MKLGIPGNNRIAKVILRENFGEEVMKKSSARNNGELLAALVLVLTASLASVSCGSKTAAVGPDLAVPVTVA
jgi:hypothetical protein